ERGAQYGSGQQWSDVRAGDHGLEILRCQQSAGRMPPSRQHFEPDSPPPLQFHFRLVERNELAIADGTADLCTKRPCPPDDVRRGRGNPYLTLGGVEASRSRSP